MRQNARELTPKKNLNLISLLANTRTKQLCLILKKYGNVDANNYDDLELKVAQMYEASPDKLAIEKELAEIHPHRSFILKHLAPKPEPTEKSANEGIANFVKEHQSNCNGNHSCSCNNHSNACGCSHFEGPTNANEPYKFGTKPTDWIGPIIMASVLLVGFGILFKTEKSTIKGRNF